MSKRIKVIESYEASDMEFGNHILKPKMNISEILAILGYASDEDAPYLNEIESTYESVYDRANIKYVYRQFPFESGELSIPGPVSYTHLAFSKARARLPDLQYTIIGASFLPGSLGSGIGLPTGIFIDVYKRQIQYICKFLHTGNSCSVCTEGFSQFFKVRSSV